MGGIHVRVFGPGASITAAWQRPAAPNRIRLARPHRVPSFLLWPRRTSFSSVFPMACSDVDVADEQFMVRLVNTCPTSPALFRVDRMRRSDGVRGSSIVCPTGSPSRIITVRLLKGVAGATPVIDSEDILIPRRVVLHSLTPCTVATHYTKYLYTGW